jgi:carbon storage regulator
MLVLTRRIGEEIVIDGHIVVTVLSLGKARVRLGIVAPQSTRVDRKEIHMERSSSVSDSDGGAWSEDMPVATSGARALSSWHE